MDAKNIGELIARRRKELGLSQAELAEKIHVTDKAVSRWETGRSIPSPSTMDPLAKALELSVSELIEGKELPPEEIPKTAGEQIVASLKNNGRMLRRGILLTLLVIALVGALCYGGYVWYHYSNSVPGDNLTLLADAAVEHILDWSEIYQEDGRPYIEPPADTDSLWIVEREIHGDYMGALLYDGTDYWGVCLYERDEVFSDRWILSSSDFHMEPGEVGVAGYVMRGDMVYAIGGGDMPSDAVYYGFRNGSGSRFYMGSVENRFLDLYFIPDEPDVHCMPILMTEDFRAWDEDWQEILDNELDLVE